MPTVLSPRDLVFRPDYRTKLEHHHAIVIWQLIFAKSGQRKRKKTFKAIIFIKFQMRNIDKVVKLPNFCLKRITPKESDFCLYSGQLFKSYYWSLSTPLVGSKLQVENIFFFFFFFFFYKSKETNTSIMSVTVIPWKQNNARAWAKYISASLMICIRIFNNGILCDIIKEKVRPLF